MSHSVFGQLTILLEPEITASTADSATQAEGGDAVYVQNSATFEVADVGGKMRPINLAEVDRRNDPARQSISVNKKSGSVIYKPHFKHRLGD